MDRYSESHAISAPPKIVRDHKQSERGRSGQEAMESLACVRKWIHNHVRSSYIATCSLNFKAKTLVIEGCAQDEVDAAVKLTSV